MQYALRVLVLVVSIAQENAIQTLMGTNAKVGPNMPLACTPHIHSAVCTHSHTLANIAAVNTPCSLLQLKLPCGQVQNRLLFWYQ